MEREFSYANLAVSEIIIHLARFISRLWQNHIFGEGNTRTTAVFFIKYIRSLGFRTTNDVFAKNAWYFRNALVRANYSDLGAGIHEDLSYLENFLRIDRWCLDNVFDYTLQDRVYGFTHLKSKDKSLSFSTSGFGYSVSSVVV